MSQIPRKPNYPSHMVDKLIQKILREVQQNVIPVSTGIFSFEKLKEKLEAIPKPQIEDYQNPIFFEIYQNNKQIEQKFNQNCKKCQQIINKKNLFIMCNFCQTQCCQTCIMPRKRCHPLSKDLNGKRFNICRQCDNRYLNLQLGHSYVQSRTLLEQAILKSSVQLQSLNEQISAFQLQYRQSQQLKQKNKYKISQLKKQKLQLFKYINAKLPEDIKIEQNKNQLLKQKFIKTHLKHKQWIENKQMKQVEKLKLNKQEKQKQFNRLRKQEEQIQRVILESQQRKKWFEEQQIQKKLLMRIYSSEEKQLEIKQRKRSINLTKQQAIFPKPLQSTQIQDQQFEDYFGFKAHENIEPIDQQNTQITRIETSSYQQQQTTKSYQKQYIRQFDQYSNTPEPIPIDNQIKNNYIDKDQNNGDNNISQALQQIVYTFQNKESIDRYDQSFSEEWILRNSVLEGSRLEYKQQNDGELFKQNGLIQKLASAQNNIEMGMNSHLSKKIFNQTAYTVKVNEEIQEQESKSISELDQNQLQNAKYNLIKAARDKAVRQRQSRKSHKMSIFDQDSETADIKKCQCSIY